MSRISILITECLQKDFVEPVAHDKPLPNKLHVGWEEARRLMGHDTETGAVAQVMKWAREQSPEKLHIIHIRDWHDENDAQQKEHLEMFGAHCLRDTDGSKLVLGLDENIASLKNEQIVNSLTLNDFEGTNLDDIVREFQKRTGDNGLRVGVIGVWTEAKISFLLYDLKTRCGINELATCSALTASASRTQHFNALDQLKKILGVSVFDSVGDFAQWLVPDGSKPAPPAVKQSFSVPMEFDGKPVELSQEDRDLINFLYRDSAKLILTPLSGGFSGASVFKVASYDSFGHELAPSVAKTGPRKLVAEERAAFERVENILGNCAPSVRGFADFGESAGIKYAFAAMTQGKVRTLKSLFDNNAPQKEIEYVLRDTFENILGKFYSAAQFERLPLLEHYGFHTKYSARVRENVEKVAGKNHEATNVCAFYEKFLKDYKPSYDEFHYVSYVHGDLNGANILIDAKDNVWIIDFFHAARSHVLKDLAKLENDLLYIFTPVTNESELNEALLIVHALQNVKNLSDPLPDNVDGLKSPQFLRAWKTLRLLRSIGGKLCHEDTNPLQLNIALLRYAVHTLSFFESNAYQKLWALAAACGHAEAVMNSSV